MLPCLEKVEVGTVSGFDFAQDRYLGWVSPSVQLFDINHIRVDEQSLRNCLSNWFPNARFKGADYKRYRVRRPLDDNDNDDEDEEDDDDSD